MSHLFGIRTTRQTKQWAHNFVFWLTARENGTERVGWPGADQNFGILIFFIKRTPAKILHQSLLVLCNFFDPTHPEGYRGTPGTWVGENQKSKLGYFL